LNPIRPLALAQVEKNLPDFRIHLNDPRPTAFGLIENDQAAEKINLSNFQTQLLSLTCAGSDRKRNHGRQMLSSSAALSEQLRFLLEEKAS